MNRVFLAFTDYNKAGGEEYLKQHKDAILASGGDLDMAMNGNFAVLRLELPESAKDVRAEIVLPGHTWMPVQGQVVPVPESALEVDEEDE
jgi:hypothetical protein